MLMMILFTYQRYKNKWPTEHARCIAQAHAILTHEFATHFFDKFIGILDDVHFVGSILFRDYHKQTKLLRNVFEQDIEYRPYKKRIDLFAEYVIGILQIKCQCPLEIANEIWMYCENYSVMLFTPLKKNRKLKMNFHVFVIDDTLVIEGTFLDNQCNKHTARFYYKPMLSDFITNQSF